ncbi:MAG TPA: ATP-binding protein [Mucilaginibacter sp.]|nr:ATP-binding protein [Mucilaginibacter sp.]
MPKTSDNLFILLLISICGVFMLIVSFILLQIRAQNKLLRQKRKLAEAETQYQKDLLHSVILSQEDDRRRIGQNLHDDVGGSLAVLRILLRKHEDQTAGQDDARVVLIDRIIENVRNVAHSLSPQYLPVLDLWEVVEELCENLNRSGKPRVEFTYTESVRSNQWDKDLSLAVFRVLQELISNTIKHAEAGLITLNFDTRDDLLLIDYRDDGKGVAPGVARKGMGLNNIVSRLQMHNATWQMDSQKGKGYHFGIAIPVKK